MSKNTNIFYLIMALSVFVSCGKKSSSSPAPAPATTHPSDMSPVVVVAEKEELDTGSYQATLRPINSSLTGEASGEFILTLKDDIFMAEAQVSGVDGGIKHYQAIMNGKSCPDENNDENFDGIIDTVEAALASGNTLLPLDSHLNSQVEGLSYGPIANEEGYYFYRRSSALGPMMEDLSRYDDGPEDDLIKLAAGSKLELSKKVIMVYGISTDVNLPDSVKARGELTPHESVPILCGQLKRLGP